jgi:hypothetical protein
MITALQRVRGAGGRDGDARRHRAERDQQVIHAVGGEDEQRPVRSEAPVKQCLADGVGRRDRRAVAAAPPARSGVLLALSDQEVPGIRLGVLAQAVDHGDGMVAEGFRRTQYQAAAWPFCCDARRREQGEGEVGIVSHRWLLVRLR